MSDERKPDWIEKAFPHHAQWIFYSVSEMKDSVRAAHEEGCLVDRRWRKAVEGMRCLVKPDSQWAECLDFLAEEYERLKKEEDDDV